MADQPISQEIRLPTNVDEVAKAAGKLDELIARVDKLDHASAAHHESSKKHQHETEGGFKGLWETMGKVVKREAELAVGIHAIGAAGLEAKGRVGEFLEFIGAEAALEMLKAIAEKFIDVGKEAVNAAAKAERMNFAIDAAAGGKEAGENVRKWVEANAKFSEFSETKNESAFLQLRRFGVGKDKAGLYMKAAEDLAAVSAPEQREGVYDEALSAFQRMHARGKLDMRSAMRLGFGVEDFAKLPQFQGMSHKAISKAVQNGSGNVTENDILNMVVSHTGEKALGEKAADASQLLLTKMAKLSELPELFFKRLGETGATKKLASEIDSIMEKLDPDGPTGKRIYGALESTFTSIVEKVGEIDFDSLADTITDDVLPAIKEMVSLIGPALKAIETTVHGLSVAAHFISGRKTGQEQAAAEMAYQKNALAAGDPGAGFWSKAWASVKTPFLAADAGLEKPHTESNALPYGLPAKYYQSGKAVVAGAAAGVSDATPAYTQSIEEMATAGEHAFTSTNEIKSPSHLFRRHGRMIPEGAALGIEDGADRIGDAMDSTFRVPADRYVGGGALAGAISGPRSAAVTIGDITIQVHGGNTNAETAAAVRDELARSLRPMLVDMMDQQEAEQT